MKTAIIGTGISGLGAAYLLSTHHDITIYEKKSYPGGHSRTITINDGTKEVNVDTGFIVFNNQNYPNLLGLFKELDVPYINSNMSFGVSINDGWLDYSSNDLFNARNIKRPFYWKMLYDIFRFNKAAKIYINKNPNITLGQCLDELKMGKWFREYYLLAMGAAIWSCPLSTILKFSASTFLKFFENHGLLSINNRPQWYSVKGGSKEYIKRLTATFQDKIRLNSGVEKILPQNNQWVITDTQGREDIYENILFACHANDAVNLLPASMTNQLGVLRQFPYQENRIIVHSDESFMPQSKKTWASWVYLSQDKHNRSTSVSLSYWMNNLQNLETDKTIIVTLNPDRRPQENLIHDEHFFSHPIFNVNAIKAQEQIDAIQGKNGLWFCGAYQRNGFHEDGLLSAVNVAKKMGLTIPWE